MTLSEVLVSMLIMSVGVVSLATLFPISVLRTAQATQLTHAVFVRNNAEAILEANLGLLSNAQLPAPTTTGLTSFTYGVIDPLGGYLISPVLPNFGGTAAPLRPRLSGGAATLAQAEQLAALPDTWVTVLDDAVTNYNAGSSPPTITVANPTTGLTVRNGQYPLNSLHRMILFDATGRLAVKQNLYQVLAGQQLSWWNVNGSGVSLTSGPALPAGFTPVRVRVEVLDRRYTWLMTVRKRWVPIGPLAGSDGAYGVAGVDDDSNSTTDDVSELRWSGSDDDANWSAEIDLAVFFNRAFSGDTAPAPPQKPGDEVPYSVSFTIGGTGFDAAYGVSGVDDDNNGTTNDASEAGWPGSDDNRTVTVTYTAGYRPFLKKGGFMLEPNLLKWYRILDLSDTSTTTTVLLIDQDFRYPATSAATVTAQGFFMRGIVEVFSLGSRTGRQ